MKKIALFIIGIAITSLAMSQTASPELVSSAGDSFTNTSYQLDWSVGECVTTTHSAGNYVITQGFHQNAYDITSEIDLRFNVNISVYPNPTSDFISLKVESLSCKDLKVESMQYTITDFTGKVLQRKNFSSDIEQINFSSYAKGMYLIAITLNNQLIKSFQIIKK